ncbi:uncharacterized protein TNIN_188851 [Trichonephila inaurata madagascariensis]|uniref:Uncharacterized protein n=1 Tax=Trichonephila inaurata madagascariensis TaxID=2747483 RepID=A0A8X7CR40_9ARAC|nr:uncharacterized protein TNIN_188851 [Trichonephila inaurata madagascariensis]
MRIFCLAVELFLFTALDIGFAETFIKNPDEKSSPAEISFRDHSSNQLPQSETVPSFADEYHYYLQMQTKFGSFVNPSMYPAITAPPDINPTSVHNSYEGDPRSVRERKPYINDDYITPYQSYCVSETPLNDKLESEKLLSSQELAPERKPNDCEHQKNCVPTLFLSTKKHQTSIKYMNPDLVREDHFSYLGVTLDNGHAEENAKKKGVQRLSLLKRLAGVTWGSSDVLTTIYKSYVRPVLDYGELLAIASKSCGDIIERIQNKALRLITSAASSTPITVLEIQTNIKPLGVRREKQLLKQFEKCMRLPLLTGNNIFSLQDDLNPTILFMQDLRTY